MHRLIALSSTHCHHSGYTDWSLCCSDCPWKTNQHSARMPLWISDIYGESNLQWAREDILIEPERSNGIWSHASKVWRWREGGLSEGDKSVRWYLHAIISVSNSLIHVLTRSGYEEKYGRCTYQDEPMDGITSRDSIGQSRVGYRKRVQSV